VRWSPPSAAELRGVAFNETTVRARFDSLGTGPEEEKMVNDDHERRDVLKWLAVLPALAALVRPPAAHAQAAGTTPVRVDTKGLAARMRFESPIAGYLTELNGKYKLRVTELTLEPGGHVGEHNHVGPGIRLMTLGEMTYVLPDKTIIYKAGEFFFESGDVNHTVYNKTDAPNQHLLFEILPVDLKGPSLMPVKRP
jgi:quercetin dioxygenase-like cupin family protein